MKILITGAAGFIGYHVALRLLNEGLDVTGLDNLNDYYDVNLKKNRLRSAGQSFATSVTCTLLKAMLLLAKG